MSTWSKISFQDACSPIMEQMIMFNDHAMIIISIITSMVSYMMMLSMMNKYENRFLLEGQTIELIWTIIPAMMLMFILMPSLKILYMLEEINKPMITIKMIGNQWFWSYEYSDFKKIEFDSYMKPTKEIEKNEFRLLENDNRLILPFNLQLRIITSSSDVIHSWVIPTLGIKIDAIPGRINQGTISIKRPGLFYGQCSEICGTNHSFMPISMESINIKEFMNWMIKFYIK